MASRQRYVTTPRPCDVPGFDQARECGLTPRVPSAPPEISVRPTARSTLLGVAAVSALAAVVILAVVFGAAEGNRLGWPAVALLLSVSAVLVLVIRAAVRRWGRAQVGELQCGYTTNPFTMGRFWFAASPAGLVTNGWVQWDWDATWVLRPDGGVVSAPSGAGDPPGLYPSPRREGALELWTGHQWSGYLPRRTRE